jgi:hypothetical protein
LGPPLLVDKDLHEAYQHTGLNSILKKSMQGLGATAAVMLIPGFDNFTEGKLLDGARDVAIEFTPFRWSRLGADLLGMFFDECQREVGQTPEGDQ